MNIDFDDTYEFPMLTKRAPEHIQLLVRSEQSIQRIQQLVGKARRHVRVMMDRTDLEKEVRQLRDAVAKRQLDDLVKGLFRTKTARNTAYLLMVGCFFVGVITGAVFV